MKDKLFFTRKDPLKVLRDEKRMIFNFLNLYSLWLFRNNMLFRESVSRDCNINFPDGGMIQRRLRARRTRGPAVTRRILTSDFSKNKRHFFIGLKEEEIGRVSKITGIAEENIGAYNPPFIAGVEFSKYEKERIIEILNRFGCDYLWVCIGNPKQEILANQIFDKIKVEKIFCIGAGLDFLLGRKKEASLVFRKLGVEWVYLGITNPKRTLKKIRRSFGALKYLDDVGVK